jgi:hypothetical protein
MTRGNPKTILAHGVAGKAHLFAARDRHRELQGSEMKRPRFDDDEEDEGKRASTSRGGKADRKRERSPIGDEHDAPRKKGPRDNANYLDDVKSARSQMRRPDGDKGLSWRCSPAFVYECVSRVVSSFTQRRHGDRTPSWRCEPGGFCGSG